MSDFEKNQAGIKIMQDNTGRPKEYRDMNGEERDIIDCLWHYLEKVPGHADRRQTGWGSKTRWGLILTVKRLILDLTEPGE